MDIDPWTNEFRERINSESVHLTLGELMTKTVIATDLAPSAIGPYSQAIRTEDLLFISGQLPMDPQSGDMVTGDIEEQTRRVLDNVKGVLSSVDLEMEDVIKTTLYISDMNDFPRINEVYGEYFSIDPPARACVEVSRLPKDAMIEMEAIASVGDHC